MATHVATLIAAAGAGYAALGILFAIAFVTAGLPRVDHAAANAPWGFRLVIIPGVVALWPWMLARWRRANRSPRP